MFAWYALRTFFWYMFRWSFLNLQFMLWLKAEIKQIFFPRQVCVKSWGSVEWLEAHWQLCRKGFSREGKPTFLLALNFSPLFTYIYLSSLCSIDDHLNLICQLLSKGVWFFNNETPAFKDVQWLCYKSNNKNNGQIQHPTICYRDDTKSKCQSIVKTMKISAH